MHGGLPAKPAVRAAKRPKRFGRLAALFLLGMGALVAACLVLAQADIRQPAAIAGVALALSGTLLLGIALGLLLARRQARSIADVVAVLDRAAAGDLTARAHLHMRAGAPDALAAGVNAVLARNQALIEGLRLVSSDIAHDLRMPIARLRRRLEAARLEVPSAQGYGAAIDRAIEDTGAIMETFSALLRIARLEAGIGPADLHLIDLSALMEDMASTYAPVAEANGQSLAAEIEPHLFIEADRSLMTQMIVNLIENAVRHTPQGTGIEVSLKRDAQDALIEIADSGPGIPKAELGHVMRRFYRLDRSRATPGSGLGLALVKAICDYHHATLTLSDKRPGLRVVIAMPIGARRALHAGGGI